MVSGLAVLLIITTLAVLPLAANSRIDLNRDWRFRTDPAAAGAKSGWINQLPSGTEPVSVPHTWNIGKYDEYEGVAWYFRSFTAPATSLRGPSTEQDAPANAAPNAAE